MQTNFTPAQLADPAMAASEKILRSCVHCGFCTATCPTYLLLGDELDSPRGRIYLIKDMLEGQKPASPEVVKHIDRCLSCLSCMTTCPSGVHYMHLVDHARAYIETSYRRPLPDRLIRAALAAILPNPGFFRAALVAAKMGKPFKGILSAIPALGERPATIRLLNRLGVEVVTVGEGCCGALVHHMGKEAQSRAYAARAIEAWHAEIGRGGLDAIVITASGCGTSIKDYGFMFREHPALAARAERVSALAKDISEYLATLKLPSPTHRSGLTVAYHSACSMQHGQKITDEPKRLLRAAGFSVKDVPEGHICCGSAGVYNMLQPQIARRLRERKVGNIARLKPDIIATGNIGCITQIAKGFADRSDAEASPPVLHTVELLDWALGGPAPAVTTSPLAGPLAGEVGARSKA